MIATEILDNKIVKWKQSHTTREYIQYSIIYLEERLHLHLEVQIKMLLLPSLKMDQYQLPIIHQMSSEMKKWRAIFWFINTYKLEKYSVIGVKLVCNRVDAMMVLILLNVRILIPGTRVNGVLGNPIKIECDAEFTALENACQKCKKNNSK